MDSVIFSSPLVLILYGVGLFLNLFDRHYKASRGWMTLVAAFFAVGASAYALILGASLRECAGVLTVFLLLNMGVRE